MVIAYYVGELVHSKKTGHDYREVKYIKADETPGSNDFRVNRHRKVKSSVWGGLDKDRKPKAPNARVAKEMIRRRKQKKRNMPAEKAAIEAAAGGRRLRVSARKNHYYNTTVERVQRPPPAPRGRNGRRQSRHRQVQGGW